MEALASGDNDHCTFVLINCAGAGGAPGFAAQHNIKACRHFSTANVPAEFGLKYIPHKVIVTPDGVVVKNYDFAGTSLQQEVDKLK
mmetsp:Transcript_35691/g.41991  ORF Transcript_35691/g.41991 Transcript_35691/m.41991 type:complete len:86 (-) Transcript_35691:210-467(-)